MLSVYSGVEGARVKARDSWRGELGLVPGSKIRRSMHLWALTQ